MSECPVPCWEDIFYGQKKRRLRGKGGEPPLGDLKASAFTTSLGKTRYQS